MGFFSWECAKTKRPVMAEDAVRRSPWDFASDVVVLFENGDRISGTYDGYGGIVGYERILADRPESSWRMVIREYYNNERFEDLPPNRHEPNQGYFWDDKDLRKIFKVG